MRIGLWFLLGCSTAIVAACTNGEKKLEKEQFPSPVFADYRVWGEEGNDEITCLLQFRERGPDGTTLLLEEPAHVELDGEILQPDSAKLAGAFYEIRKPLNQFAGKHTIVFTDLEKKEHRFEFGFYPFGLVTEVPGKIRQKAFFVYLSDFPTQKTPVHLMLTDTAFSTDDVNEIIEVENGRVEITTAMLNKLKAGPVVMEIVRESDQPLAKNMNGKIWMSYGLRREFELQQ